jgi:hypothetical protein
VPYEEEVPEGANVKPPGGFCPFGGILDSFLHHPKVVNKKVSGLPNREVRR